MSFFRRLAMRAKSRHPEEMLPKVGDLLEAAPDAMIIVNSEGKIVVANSQAEVLFGYSRPELIGQPVEILIPGRFNALHLRHRTAFLNEQRCRPMGAGLSLFGKRKNETEFPVEISLSPLQTEKGVFVISAVRDTTDRNRAEEQIKQLNAELAAALRRAEQLGPTGDLAISMAREIEASLDNLTRLLSQIERLSGAGSGVQAVVDQAREQVMQIGDVTSKSIGLQQEHDIWKRT